MPFDPPVSASGEPASAEHRQLLSAIRRGLSRRCPHCGTGALFKGFLAVQSPCPTCGSINDDYPSDDFAPYVTIFLVLHLMVPMLFFVDRFFKPSVVLESVIAIPVFAASCAALLPFAKGGVIGFAYALNVTRSGTSPDQS